MKTLTCDLCDHKVQGETFKEWMNALKPHYKEAHADFIEAQGTRPPEKVLADMAKWMKENKERFDAA
jgi:hypothetical protein